jgi:hypothetical protein
MKQLVAILAVFVAMAASQASAAMIGIYEEESSVTFEWAGWPGVADYKASLPIDLIEHGSVVVPLPSLPPPDWGTGNLRFGLWEWDSNHVQQNMSDVVIVRWNWNATSEVQMWSGLDAFPTPLEGSPTIPVEEHPGLISLNQYATIPFDVIVQSDPGVVPEPATLVAGALLLLPFGLQGIRMLRNRK